MSRRRLVGTLFIVAALGLGLYFLFRDAPVGRTLTYDLGANHASVVRLEIRIALDGALVREARWFFEPGEAPRRVAHRATLPARDLEMEIRVTFDDGEVHEEHRDFDGRAPGDVVIHLSPRG